MSQRSPLSTLFHADELRALCERSNLQGARAVLTSWALIASAFALAGLWPNALTVALAVVLLGGQQLALLVLMHEAAHGTLFASARLNQWVGQGLCGWPVWNHLDLYRRHHLAHHAHAGTEQDPDRSLAEGFPVSRSSLGRKLLRDALGVTGLKRVLGLVLMDLGFIEYTVSKEVRRIDQTGRRRSDVLRAAGRRLLPVLVANALLLGALAALGHAWLYFLWVLAFLTSLSIFLRVRSIAEHAMTSRSSDPLLNTRTTRAGLLARLTVAPFGVNHHLEHHLLMSVPFFRLAGMHRLLRGRGALEGTHLAHGYLEVLGKASSAPR